MIKAQARTGDTAGLLTILAAGLGLRMYLLAFKTPGIGSDEAVIGLMARHILQGERPLLYYGQSYYGAIDAYLNAPLLAIFGNYDLVLHLVPLAASLLFVPAIYLLGRRLYSRQVGLWSAAYAAAAPAFLALRGIKADAAYSVVLLVSALALLVFDRLQEQFSWQRLAGLAGLCLLGLWIFPLMGYTLAAIGLTWLFQRAPRLQKERRAATGGRAWWGGLLVLLGLLAAGIAAWQGTGRGILLGLGSGIGRFFSIAFPILIGTLPPAEYFPVFEQQAEMIPAGIRALIVVFGLAVFALGMAAGMARFRQGKPLLFVYCSTTLLIFILFFSMINITPAIFSFPRYLFPLYCTIPLWVDAFLRLSAGRNVLRIAGAVLFLGINLSSNLLLAVNPAPAPALLAWANRQSEQQYAYVDYWSGYWLAFESQEKVVPFIVEANRPGNNRYPAYAAQVQAAAKPVYIYGAGSASEGAFIGLLQAEGIGYQMEQAGGYDIFSDLTHPVRFDPQGMRAE